MKLFELAKIKTKSRCWDDYLNDISSIRNLYKNPLTLWILVEQSSPQELKKILDQLSEIAKTDRTTAKIVKAIKNFRRK